MDSAETCLGDAFGMTVGDDFRECLWLIHLVWGCLGRILGNNGVFGVLSECCCAVLICLGCGDILGDALGDVFCGSLSGLQGVCSNTVGVPLGMLSGLFVLSACAGWRSLVMGWGQGSNLHWHLGAYPIRLQA